jgi:PAS domain S-box-containing protein
MFKLNSGKRKEWLMLTTIGVAYFLAHQISYLFPDASKILMAIWPAAGIGLASLLLTPRRLWLKIIIVIFIAGNLANIFSGRPILGSLGFMSVNVLESLLCASFIKYWSGQDLVNKKTKGIYALVFSSIAINAIVAFLGAGTAVLVSNSPFWSFWQTWYIADGLGLLLITPVIIFWFGHDEKLLKNGLIHSAELLLTSFLFCYITYLIFNHNWIYFEYSLRPYLLFAITAWLAVRFDIRVLSLNLVLSVIIILSSYSITHGPSPFDGDNLTERLINIQIFIAVLSITAFLLNIAFIERKVAIEASDQSEKKYKLLFDNSSEAMLFSKPNGEINNSNPAACKLLGYTVEEICLLGRDGLFDQTDSRLPNALKERKNTGSFKGELKMIRKDGMKISVELYSSIFADESGILLAGTFIRDITKEKQLEEERKANTELLKILNSSQDKRQLIHSTTSFMKIFLNCDAVGIRLKEDGDFPYYETQGFPEEFVELENYLCKYGKNNSDTYNKKDNPLLECMCGNVLCNRFDPTKPFFTSNGSFWSNCITDLLASTTEADRLTYTRNRCKSEGYESVGLFPIRYAGETFGLLQVNSKQKGLFNPHLITFLEQSGNNLSIALSRLKTIEILEASENRYSKLFLETIDGCSLQNLIFDEHNVPIDYITFDVNPAYEKILYVKKEDVVGKKASEFLPPDELKKWLELFAPVAMNGDNKLYENYSPNTNQYFEGNVFSPQKNQFATIFRDVSKRKLAEDALRESENRFSSAFEFSAIGMALVSPEGRWLKVNRSLCEIIGYSEDELLSKTFQDITHPDDLEKDLEYVRQMLAGDIQTYQMEKRYFYKDGRVIWILLSVSLVKDVIGKPLYFISQIENINKRKQAEDEVQKNERQLSNAAKIAKLGYWEYDVASDLFTFNDSFFAIFRTTVEQVGGYSMTAAQYAKQFVHPDDAYQVALETREALQTMDSNYSRQLEHRIVYANGEIGTVAVRIFIVKNENGRTIKTFGVNQDITERKLAEFALVEKELKYSAIFKSMGQGFYISEILYDAAGIPFDYRYLECNAAFEQISGLRQEQLIGKTYNDLVPPDPESGWCDCFIRVAITGKSENYSFKSAVYNCYFEVYAFIPEKGKFCALVRDITESKLASEKLKDSEEKFRAIFENSKDAIGISYNGISVMLNKAYLDMFGYENSNELVGKSLLENISPKEHDRIKEYISKRNLEQEAPNYYETFGIQKNGIEFPFELNVGTYILNDKRYTVGIIRDITERKQAEETLLQKTALLEAQLNATIDGILIIDSKGKKLLQNKRNIELFKIPKNLSDNIDDQLQLEYVTNFNKDPERFAKKVSYLYDHPLETSRDEFELKDGTVVDRYSAPVLGKGEHNYGRIWIFRDITERKRAEQAILESEQKYRLLFESAGVGIAHYSTDGTIYSYNTVASDYLGGKPENFKGKSIYKIFPKAEAELYMSRIKLAVKSELPQEYLDYIELRSGKKWFLSVFNRLSDSQNNIIGVQIISTDITAQKNAEELLKASEEKFRSAFQYAAFAIALVNTKKQFISVNPTFYNMLGYSENELKQKSFNDITHPDDISKGMKLVKELYAGKREYFWLEKRYMHKDGHVVWGLLSTSLVRDSNNNPLFTVAQIQDITERKRAEQELTESEQRFKYLAEASEEGIEFSENGIVLDCNEKMNRMFLGDNKSIIGQSIFNYVAPESHDLAIAKIKDKSENVYELTGLKSDGTTFPIEVKSATVEYKGRRASVAVIRDLTLQKEMENKILNAIIEAEERERDRISHELHDGLGPLLSTIKLYFQWIVEDTDVKKKESIAKKGNNNIDEAINLVREISHNLSPRVLINFGFITALKNHVDLINNARKLEISFESNTESRFEKNIEFSLYRITNELINNTIKHSKAKQAAITILYDEVANTLKFNYFDNGNGFNVKNALNKGHGLGLNNLIQRITSLNGKINIKSKTGKGMEVNIELPVK